MRRICEGIVAEKSATCLSSGVSARIVSTSSAKPILSISSASSSTRKRSWRRSRVPFSRWSMMRPGVPTTMCTPRRKRAELHAVGLATVDGQHVHARQPSGIPLEGLAHLQGELAGGSQHERLWRLLLEVELAEDGQRKGRRLAGAGLREPDDVPPLEQRGDRRLLDRRRVLVAELLEALQDSLVEPQVGKPRTRRCLAVSPVGGWRRPCPCCAGGGADVVAHRPTVVRRSGCAHASPRSRCPAIAAAGWALPSGSQFPVVRSRPRIR